MPILISYYDLHGLTVTNTESYYLYVNSNKKICNNDHGTPLFLAIVIKWKSSLQKVVVLKIWDQVPGPIAIKQFAE